MLQKHLQLKKLKLLALKRVILLKKIKISQLLAKIEKIKVMGTIFGNKLFSLRLPKSLQVKFLKTPFASIM